MIFDDFHQLVQTRRKEGTLYDSQRNVAREVEQAFLKSEEILKAEFFKGIEKDLDANNISNLFYYLCLLSVDAFKEADNERFQNIVIKAIEKLENDYDTLDASTLGSFIWILLDYMLHSWLISDKQALYARLKKFKNSLKHMESKFPDDELALLYQKLGQFGAK